MEKCDRTGEVTDENMQHAHFKLGTESYTHFWNMSFFAFPLQHWWHAPASVLLYTCIACLVTFTEAKRCRFNFCLGITYITLPKRL